MTLSGQSPVSFPVYHLLTSPADVPFAAEGREIAKLLKSKVPDDEIQPVIERIHAQAIDNNLDPLVTSTDVFVTAVLHVGSKSLSHVLAAIERTKDRLTDAGAASEAARAQIISSVMEYWSSHPGIAITIIEKLLNYSILTPLAVINWALVSYAGSTKGESLARAHIYELVFNTVMKVTGRVRQVVQKAAKQQPQTGDGDAMAVDTDFNEVSAAEVKGMRALFAAMEDALVSWATGTKDEILETDGDGKLKAEREAMVKRWGECWLRVFRRRMAIEEAFLVEAGKEKERLAAVAAAAAANGEGADGDGDVAVADAADAGIE